MKSNVNVHDRSLFDGQLNNSDNIELFWKDSNSGPEAVKQVKKEPLNYHSLFLFRELPFAQYPEMENSCVKTVENCWKSLVAHWPLRCFVVSTWLVSVPNTNFGLCKHVKVNINSLWEHPTAAEETAKKHYRNIYILNILWIITRLRCPLLPSPLPFFPSLLSNVKCARLWHMLETLDVARLFLWRMASNLSEISRYETVF